MRSLRITAKVVAINNLLNWDVLCFDILAETIGSVTTSVARFSKY
jgi:hypothetical protein